MIIFPPSKAMQEALSKLYERDEIAFDTVLDSYDNEDEFLEDYAMLQAYNHFSK